MSSRGLRKDASPRPTGWADSSLLLLRLAQVTQWGDFIHLLYSPFFFKPFNLLFLFSLQLCDIYTFLGYSSHMRLHYIASDICQKELQMFQRKCAETMWLKQNKLCLKSRKCPNKWEMHQFLWELFSLPLPPVFFFVFLLYCVVQQMVLSHETVCSKAQVGEDF